MAKLLPLQPGLGRLVIGPRPHTAPTATARPFTARPTGARSGRTWIHTDRVRPVTHHPGRRLTPDQVEPLIHGRLASLRSAFAVADPAGTGLVSKEEFGRVLESMLRVSRNQLDAALHEVCEASGETVDYMQFLRSFRRRAPAGRRACSSRGSVRRGPPNTSMSLSDIQKHLKDKIGGNLRTVIRVFRLFDYNRGGHIQQGDFRRILDNYCIRLTDKEFQRLWNHYSPNNTSTISYEVFLEKLGFGDSHDFKIAPVCTKLEVSSRGTTPLEKVKQRKQRPESPSSSCDAPSVLPHRKLQSLFHDKMCVNSTPVWQALRAFDTTHSGLVKQDVLRAVLSSFIFPMNPHSFQRLTSRYGVRGTGPVRWKHFLGHFMSPLKEEGDANLHPDRAFEQPAPNEDNLHLQDIYPRLKEIFRLLDTEAGWFTRADLRHLLQRPSWTQPQTLLPRLRRSQITELLNALDPEHTGVIQQASLERLNPAPTNAAEPLDVPEETEDTAQQQKPPDETQAEQCADKVRVASASWRTVENPLLEKCVCEQLGSALAALKLCDPQQTGYVTREDLKEVLSCYGMTVSDTHFNKLCETSGSRPGTSSKLVYYSSFLRELGVPLPDETSSSHEEGDLTERPQTVKGQRPPSVVLQDSNILDVVFQKMRSRLERRCSSLTDRIQAVARCPDGTLSDADVRRILEDSWVTLDDKTFAEFTELLGFRGGRIERSAFLAKYEEATARDGQRGSEGHVDAGEVDPPLTSAEQCLAAMKTRIKSVHGDNLTAFRLMDRKRKGVVDCHDFKALYSSLGFLCREGEYERLLDLIGLHPGGNLNYAEFVDVVENGGKQGAQTTTVQEQLHDLLAREARYKWADMSKVLCQFDSDGHGWIHKKSLRGLLFTYALPLRPEEFDQLWSRYDPEQRGCVAVCDFMEKLGFHHEGELKPRSQKLNQADAQQDADEASLECIRLNASTDENCKKPSYMDFLSALDPKAEKKREPPPASPDAVRQIESLSGLSPGMALVRMRELVTASASNLFKAFSAFDRGGTGTVKALVFRQVLDNFCARLSDKQYRYMLGKLELDCENCAVNWKDFLNKFQSQSTPMSADRCHSRTKTRSPVQTKTSDIPEHLQQVQEMVSGHLHEIAKELTDLDPSDSSTVSKEQFRRLCDRHRLRLTNDQFERVWSHMPVSEQKTLQCGEFLKRFGAVGGTAPAEAGGATAGVPPASPEPGETASATKSCCPEIAGVTLQRTKSAPQCTSRRPASVGRPGTGSLLGSAERKLRGAVRRRWKEIQRSCTEEDPQHKGHISTASFLEILQSLSIDLTREQLEHLAVKSDIMSNGCVSYHSFLRHFVLNLKPAEAKRTFERRKLPLPTTPASRGVLSEDCVRVMLRMHDDVRSSWTAVRRCFLASDRARTGSVSVQDFRKALRHFGVNLSSEEFFHLSSYFDADTAGKIGYNDFLWAFLH